MNRPANSGPMGLTRHVFDALQFWSANNAVRKETPEGHIIITWRGREYNIVITRRD